jgi:hypothetical protein
MADAVTLAAQHALAASGAHAPALDHTTSRLVAIAAVVALTVVAGGLSVGYRKYRRST